MTGPGLILKSSSQGIISARREDRRSDKGVARSSENPDVNAGFVKTDLFFRRVQRRDSGGKKMRSTSQCANPAGPGSLGKRATPAAIIASVVALAGVVVWVVFGWLAGAVDLLIDWRGAIFVGVVPVMILVGIFGWAAPIDAFFYVAGRRDDAEAARDAAQFFQLWAAFALASGFIATGIGLMLMLATLNDPSQIGPSMAIALLSQLYGVCLAVFCVACSVSILRRYPNPDASRQLTRQVVAGAGITVIAGTMATLIAFGILLISVSPWA